MSGMATLAIPCELDHTAVVDKIMVTETWMYETARKEVFVRVEMRGRAALGVKMSVSGGNRGW